MEKKSGGVIITIAKRAGGVGATTCVFNLGCVFAELGYRVLLVDMAPQRNLTKLADVTTEDSLTIFGVFANARPIMEAVTPTKYDNLSIIPSDKEMSILDFALAEYTAPDRRYVVLRDWFEQSNIRGHFDITLLDLDPAMNGTAMNSLAASTHYANPVEATGKGIESIQQLDDEIPSEVFEHNPDLSYLGTFVVNYDARTRIQREVMEQLQEQIPEAMFNACIRTNTRFQRAYADRQSIAEWESRNKDKELRGSSDMRALGYEFLERLGMRAAVHTKKGVANE